MKIPETSANVGAYYGNEENGQWQPNGVIIDSGVGGGIVGSGDAGIHRPPVYPVHLPRGHMPGYVMAGAYYPPAAYPPVPAPPQDDFADYMWMENEEEFDKQVMQQLEEEALMEQCIEAMLEDEQRERHNNRPQANGHNHHYPTTSNGTPSLSLEETVSRSTLNPLAAEFVPTGVRSVKEDRQDTPEAPVTEEPSQKTEEAPSEQTTPVERVDDEPVKTEEPVPPQKDPPEVSAADIPPVDNTQKTAPKEVKKEPLKPKVEPKKPVKTITEMKAKVKPVAVKSETKVQPKKKEVKSIKSDTKTEEIKTTEEVIVEVVKPQPQPVLPEEPAPPSGFKPINYAAAAKANKPKKPSPPPTIEKPQPQPQPAKIEKIKTEKIDKKDKPKTDNKPPLKTEKTNVQRKNSAK